MVGGHDSAHLNLTGPDGAVDFTARVEGNTVVLDPVERLATDTEYTMQVGTEVTDLAGNPVVNTVSRTFRTATYVDALPSYNENGFALVNVAQTAPFITTIQPGVPCALDPTSGDFLSGGDTAGYCKGDDQGSEAPSTVFPVFSLPANKPIKAQFTKPVKSQTITLADDCLTGGGTAASGASIAVQRMGADGSCEGVVDGRIRLPQPDQPFARSFTFVPDRPWEDGQRYWLVICGDAHDQCSTAAGTIVGRDDGNGVRYVNTDGDVVNAPYSGNLNTDPLNGTGTQAAQGTGLPADAANTTLLSQGFRPAAGGPDIVMPFDGAPASRDYGFFADSLPIADSNGNGTLEGQAARPGGPFNPIPESLQPLQEHHIAANATYVQPESTALNFSDQQAVYQSGAVPNIVKPMSTDCGEVGEIIGTTPARCVPIELTSGGMFELTALQANRRKGTQTGRILLRVARDDNGARQRGYIVPECSGTVGSGADARDYDYSPCFVQSLDLIANGPDGIGSPLINVTFAQQWLTLDLVGPVNFERNGRLVLTLSNINEAVLDDITVSVVYQPSPITITLAPGDAHIQLAGLAIHGGQVTVQ